jgi:hypothetical protein
MPRKPGPPLGGEVNPEQGVLAEVREHWYKIAGILLYKLNKAQGRGVSEEVDITIDDLQRFARLFGDEMPAVVYYPSDDVIRLWLLPESEARKKARQ